jgi:hypothetical protein
MGLSAIGTALLAGNAGTAVATSPKPRLNWTFAPVPIPSGSPTTPGFHVFGPNFPDPAAADPVDAEPSTITNFNGSIGLAYISGMVTRTDLRTGERQYVPFLDSDMRFMTGLFRGVDGQEHPGTFSLV